MPESSEAGVNPSGGKRAAEVAALKAQVEELRVKAEENLAGWQRTQADFENYRRRSEQEKAELGDMARGGLVLALLPFLDDTERALAAIPADAAEAGWVDGIRMIARKFYSILTAQGVSPIKALDEAFDPNYHEAVTQAPGAEGVVVQEFERGYMFGHRIIRFSKVAVGNGEAPPPEAAIEDFPDEWSG
jgi:molecular chaperone GrpE